MALGTLRGGIMPSNLKTEDGTPQKRHEKILRMDPALWERLRLVAFNLRRPQNDIIVEALQAWLDRHEAEGQPQ
jgi:hypothetical protein